MFTAQWQTSISILDLLDLQTQKWGLLTLVTRRRRNNLADLEKMPPLFRIEWKKWDGLLNSTQISWFQQNKLWWDEVNSLLKLNLSLWYQRISKISSHLNTQNHYMTQTLSVSSKNVNPNLHDLWYYNCFVHTMDVNGVQINNGPQWLSFSM